MVPAAQKEPRRGGPPRTTPPTDGGGGTWARSCTSGRSVPGVGWQTEPEKYKSSHGPAEREAWAPWGPSAPSTVSGDTLSQHQRPRRNRPFLSHASWGPGQKGHPHLVPAGPLAGRCPHPGPHGSESNCRCAPALCLLHVPLQLRGAWAPASRQPQQLAQGERQGRSSCGSGAAGTGLSRGLT